MFKNWIKYLKQKYESFYLRKYYLTIHELPIFNWTQFYKTTNPIYLSRTGKICKRVSEVYKSLESQLIDEFGISEDYLKIINLKIEIELLYGEQIRTGDRSNQLLIDIREVDINSLSNQNNKSDLMQALLTIEKFMGLKLNPKELSVFDFYNYLKFVSENKQ